VRKSRDEITLIREYLLGRLDESEKESLEERFVRERDVIETLAAVESELIDDYVKGVLPAAERQALEGEVWQTPERMAKAASARALAEYATHKLGTREPMKRGGFWEVVWARPLFQPAIIAAILLVITLGAWLAIRGFLGRPSRLRSEVSRLNEPGQLNGEPSQILGPLRPGLVRGETGIASYHISNHDGVIQIRFSVPPAAEFAEYQIIKETDARVEIFKVVRPLEASGDRELLLNVNGRNLEPGDHYFRIRGISDSGQVSEIASYTLVITR